MDPSEAVKLLTQMTVDSTSVEEGYRASAAIMIGRSRDQNAVTELGHLLGSSYGQGVERQFNSNPAFVLGAVAAAFEKLGYLQLERGGDE